MNDRGERVSLDGMTVVWTGTADSGESLFTTITASGATLEHLPLLETGAPRAPEAIPRAFNRIGRYSWLVFTSAEAVRQVAEQLPPDVPIAAVGPATARALERIGRPPSVVPETAGGRHLADALVRLGPIKPVLFVRGNRALRTVPETLEAAGIAVEEVEVYATQPVSRDRAEAVCEKICRVADVVVMGSPAGVGVLHQVVAPAPLKSINPDIKWISLGEKTSSALRAAGATRLFQLSHPTNDALAAVLFSLDLC